MTESISSPPAVSDRRLIVLIVVLLLGATTTILDTTIVNVALDHLHTVFHASVAATQWVVSGYLLGLAGVIPLTGWASERFGSKRVWIFAVAAFLLGSVLCGLAPNLPVLITFRVLQGIGGGMVLPLTMTMLTQAAGPKRVARAMAAIVIPAQLAPILGPVIGGALVDSVGWNWLFFVNVPLCVLALILGPILLPTEAPKPQHSLDIRGFLLLAPGLVALAYGISEGGTRDGFGVASSWIPMVIGVALIASFIVYALNVHRLPLIDVRLFGRRSFGVSSIVVFFAGFSSFAAMFLLPVFYQAARGNSASMTGLLLIPQGVGTITFVLLHRRLGKNLPPRAFVIAGVVLTMLAMVPFAVAGSSGSDLLLLAAQFVQGFGSGAIILPLMTVSFASLEASEIPRASAAFNVVQRVGAPFGVTVVAVLLQGYLSGTPIAGSANVIGAFGATFWWVLAFGVVPLVLAFFLPHAAKREGAGAPDAAETFSAVTSTGSAH